MASAQRTPRDIPFEADAEYQRLAEQHRQYEAELQKISKSPYLNSEDLLEEIKLKKMKLHCKVRVSYAVVPITPNNGIVADETVVE